MKLTRLLFGPFVFAFILAPILVHAQAKQPVLSTKVVRVAYINQAKLRQQYKAYQNTKVKAKRTLQESQQAYKQDMEKQEKQLAKDVEIDKQQGGHQQESIKKRGQAEQQALEQTYKQKWRQFLQERNQALQACEQKINNAVSQVIAEGGFTEARTIEKETELKGGVDVTDLILKKLN